MTNVPRLRERAETAERSEAGWRERALEAEARLERVSALAAAMSAELLVDDDTVARLQRVVTAPSPTVAPGQTWEVREGDRWRQALVLGPTGPTWRPHHPGATFWRIRSQRGSTIREDVLRRRWRLVDRGDHQHDHRTKEHP